MTVKIERTAMTMLLALTMAATATAQTPQDSTKVDIGYGSGNAKTTAGAVDKVTQERMNKGLVNNSLDALSGQAAGVQVQTGGNQEAMLNAVRVRGTTSSFHYETAVLEISLAAVFHFLSLSCP